MHLVNDIVLTHNLGKGKLLHKSHSSTDTSFTVTGAYTI